MILLIMMLNYSPINLEPAEGVEPTIYGLQNRRSNQLSYAGMRFNYSMLTKNRSNFYSNSKIKRSISSAII